MAKKIYVKSNYFYIVDTETDYIYEGLAKEVRVRKLLENSEDFFFDNVNGFTTSVNFADIQDESGVAYVDLATFVAFYQENTGNFNSPQAGGDYKIYRALLSQIDTDNPTANVLENTIGNIVWTTTDVGQYIGTLTNAFTNDKTFLYVSQGNYGADFPNFYSINRNSNNEIGIITQLFDGTFTDGLLTKREVQIIVYN